MTAFYGAKLADAWAGANIGDVKAVWSEALAEYSNEEIGAGVAALLTRTWPPTLPEFLLLCRPPIDPATAHAEACHCYVLWCEGKNAPWTRPEIFWAAQKIGIWDLRNSPFQQIKGRWAAALEQAPRAPIPEPRIPLPGAGDIHATPAHVEAIFERLGARRMPKTDKEAERMREKAAAEADIARREQERLRREQQETENPAPDAGEVQA